MRLFVYGTLKNPAQFTFITGKRRVGAEASLSGYRLMPFGDYAYYPSIESKSGARVDGVVYTVDSNDLVNLDHYEGVPDLYRRDVVELDDGEEAYVYVQNRAYSWAAQ
jgi:gamma-glutamylaminecyclotransferase